MADEITSASGGIAAPASGVSGASPATQTQVSTNVAAPAAQGTPALGTTDSTADRNPLIPRERFDEVNTRMTEAERQLADWKQYEWAKSVDQRQLSSMADWYGRYQGDPAEFLDYAYQEALKHPVHGATVKSRIGKMLASMRAQEVPQEPDAEPDIPVLDANGQVVNKTGSWDAIVRLVRQELTKGVKPLQEDLRTRTEREQSEQSQRQQSAFIAREATRVKADVFKLKGAEAQWPAIQAKAKELIAQNADISVGEACRDAYYALVFPTLTPAAKDEVLSDFQRKAHAQTVHPGAPSGTATPKFKSFADAHAYYAEHPDEAAAMANR